MSLLHDPDFLIFQLRTGYLSQIRDGVGERLINVDTNFLNDPAYRAGGWNPNPPEIKRTYSPPIPTAGTAEYFKIPVAVARHGEGSGDDEEEGGMITGRGSADTVGPSIAHRRRRRREATDEDDSSDLSDESNDEPEPSQRPGQSIRFTKVSERPDPKDPRNRSGSSPLRGIDDREGPSVMITSPSKPPSGRLRGGSFNQADVVRSRARRDTTTSSDMSSEGDLDPSLFRRQKIRARPPGPSRIDEDDELSDVKEKSASEADSDDDEDDEDDDDDDASLASDFSETIESGSLLADVVPNVSSPLQPPPVPQSPSPRKAKPALPVLTKLPPPRPISQMQPVSALSAAIKARNKKSESPFERFAPLSGAGLPNPLYIKIYPPKASGSTKPIEIALRRQTNDGTPVSVADAIGFSLWRYTEVKMPIPKTLLNINRWTLRIVEDGEIDYDFPALGRTRPIYDFTSNNNRPMRGRSRDKPWDEFGLVEATETQAAENDRLTPQFTDDVAEEPTDGEQETEAFPPMPDQPSTPTQPEASRPPQRSGVRPNLITDPRSAMAAFRKDSSNAMDLPDPTISHAARRMGAQRTLKINFTDNSLQPHILPVEATTDTYLAEVFDQVCQRLGLDKGLYVLKVTGTATIAPSDRTVEALGPERDSLDLVRRRFVGDGSFGHSGSPGSSSPNAPLLLTASGTPTKKMRKQGTAPVHPLAQQTDLLALVGSAGANYKRYIVIRKQPMSFTPSTSRAIVIDGEYLHIMPNDSGKGRGYEPAQGKPASFHFSNVIGCKVNRKHPKTMRVLVFRERETKRYDFEARSADEAAEIVHELKKGMEPFRDMDPTAS